MNFYYTYNDRIMQKRPSPKPLYRQVYESIRQREAEFQNDKLTERFLMGEFTVSQDTARKVLNLLEAEGRVRRLPGRGTFLTEKAGASPRFFANVLVNELFFMGERPMELRRKFFVIMSGILQAARREQCEVRIHIFPNGEDPKRTAGNLLKLGPGNGILLLSPSGMGEVLAQLHRERFPYMVHVPVESPWNSVSDDSAPAIEGAVGHLLDWGRRRILYLASAVHTEDGQFLLRAFARAHENRKLKVDPSQVIVWEHPYHLPAPHLEQAISRGDFDGIFASSAELTQALLPLLKRVGVGGKVALLSYEDSDDFLRMETPVAAIRVPLQRIGAAMFEEMLAMLRFGFRGDVRVTLPDEIEMRASAGL